MPSPLPATLNGSWIPPHWEISSIYAQSFSPHYRISLVDSGTYPHSNDHMADIAAMTTLFSDLLNIEMTQPAPSIPALAAFPHSIQIDLPLQHDPCNPFHCHSADKPPKVPALGGIKLLQFNTLPNFVTFQPTPIDFSSNASLDLHLWWAELPAYSKPPQAPLYYHVTEYLMFEMNLLSREDNLLCRWTHGTIGPTDHCQLYILNWMIT